MSLLGKPADQISVEDLRGLIDNEIFESRFIEYKSIGSFREVSDKIKFLAGISSFANSGGGDFIIGIRAEDGIPKEITGVPSGELDPVKLQIEQIIQTGLSPRIYAHVHVISVDELSVILIRVQRSWAQPHRVILAGHDKFYGRHSAGKFPMDIDQLRAAFLFAGTARDRLQRMQGELVNKILTAHTPAPLESVPLIAMQMLPYESLDGQKVVDIELADMNGGLLNPIGHDYGTRRFNLDGLMTSVSADTPPNISGYTQLFRSGVIESVSAGLSMTRHPLSGQDLKQLPSSKILVEVLNAYRRFLDLQRALSIAPPVMVIVTVMNVRGWVLAVNASHGHLTAEIDRDHLVLPPVTVNNFDDRPEAILRPAFDALWNASGWPRCLNYGDDGSLAGHIRGNLRY